MSSPVSRGSRPFASGILAFLSALALIGSLAAPAIAATDTKPYTATWLSGTDPVANPPNTITVAGGSTTATLRLTNDASPQSVGSANITLPTGYGLLGGSVSSGSATVSGNTLQLRNLNLASSASTDITISFRAPCITSGAATWALIVKQANNFSGPPGNDFVRSAGTVAPSTSVTASRCLLRFANQPTTTKTGLLITDGFGGSGDPIRVEIYDPATNAVVDSDATVTLTPDANPAEGTLSGGSVAAVDGVATFLELSLDKPGSYTLKASSAAASNEPVSDRFMVSDTVTACTGTGCSFTQDGSGSSFTTTPTTGTNGAGYATSLNLSGLRISCDFAPFFYSDLRQPNAVWYVYDDGATGSTKTNVIVIDKSVVQATPENGASKYRVCYSSPVRFTDRSGNPAPEDPWTDPDTEGRVGPSVYFGETWYTGLLPDCGNKKVPPAPCVIGWTGSGAGDRIGRFVTPGGDPSYR